MYSIHTNKEYEEEYKEQFRNMTDEQIEQHIKLERVRNIIDGYPKEYGIKQIRKLVKELREENESDKFITGETDDELLDKYTSKKRV